MASLWSYEYSGAGQKTLISVFLCLELGEISERWEGKGDEKNWVFATINTISVTATIIATLLNRVKIRKLLEITWSFLNCKKIHVVA